MFLINKTVIAWHCGGLYNCIIPHWMQNLVLKSSALANQSLALADKSYQRVRVLGSTVSSNWGNCPKHTKRCIIQLAVRLSV